VSLAVCDKKLIFFFFSLIFLEEGKLVALHIFFTMCLFEESVKAVIFVISTCTGCAGKLMKSRGFGGSGVFWWDALEGVWCKWTGIGENTGIFGVFLSSSTLGTI
jgi:hypothetical protein